MSLIAVPALMRPLHRGSLSRELGKLLRCVATYSRSPCISRSANCGDILQHRLAIRHFDRNDNVVLTRRHVDAEQPSAQFFYHRFTALITIDNVFYVFGTLVSSIQEANKRRHDLLPLAHSETKQAIPGTFL
jgi:hypothetical protein